MTDNILIQRFLLFLRNNGERGGGKQTAVMTEQTRNNSKHRKTTSGTVTFTSSVTLTAFANPPVSSRPDPVWKDRMWDTYIHISSYIAGNVFSK